MLETWIDTQISSYLIPSDIWESGYAEVPPLALPARDAVDIERRWKKGVTLNNESRRYTICCERLQGIASALVAAGAPISPPVVWPSHSEAAAGAPSALAYLAMYEYLRRLYKPIQTDAQGRQSQVGLKHRRLESIFHAPGQSLTAFLSLLDHITHEPKLAEMFDQAAQKAEVSGSHQLTATDCRYAFEQRRAVIAQCSQAGFGVVDVFDLL